MAKRGSDREPSIIEARRGQTFKDFEKKIERSRRVRTEKRHLGT